MAPATGFDAESQSITLLGADGTTIVRVALPQVDALILEATSTQVNYGSQIGATFVMLLVVLAMTPRARLWRVTALINLAALATNIVRCVLLSLFFTSSWVEFYTLTSGDDRYVRSRDYAVSAAATVATIPLIVLIEMALAVQAWSMIKLWPGLYKWGAVVVSLGLAVSAVGFKFGDSVLQALGIVGDIQLDRLLWVRQTDLVLSMASICWFCFLFVVRIAIHMWTHRTMLPSVRGMSAMEVLVMTNGVLMLVPVLFAGLEFGSFTQFESGSLTYTSVVVVLPLGNLAAQRLANPAAFASPGDSTATAAAAAATASHATSSGARVPFLAGGHHWQGSGSTTLSGSRAAHGVSTHVVSCGSCEKGSRPATPDTGPGVRVDRVVEQREEWA